MRRCYVSSHFISFSLAKREKENILNDYYSIGSANELKFLKSLFPATEMETEMKMDTKLP
jgi:hypothetical protein